MPTVPKDQSRVFRAFMGERPSDTDLLMALATMKELGRVPTFDERFRGQDPSNLPLDVSAKGKPIFGQGKAKAEQIPSREADVLDRESIGVVGGSH